MTEHELDQALMAPLPEIADAGFSQAVLLRAMEEKARRERDITCAIAGGAALLCALMPFTRFGHAVDQWAIGFGRDLSGFASRAMNLSDVSDALNLSSLSLPLAITAAALTLTLLVTQAFPSRR